MLSSNSPSLLENQSVKPRGLGQSPKAYVLEENKKEARPPTLTKLKSCFLTPYKSSNRIASTPHCYVMITKNINFYNPITQSIYDEHVKILLLWKMPCSCNHRDCLIRHAYYTRKLKTIYGIIELRILRVKCKFCGKTHAILPETIVPYSQIPVDIQQIIITNHSNKDVLSSILYDAPDITPDNVHHILCSFWKYWHQRLLSENVSVSLDIADLCSKCLSTFRRQFMQIRKGTILHF